MSRIVLERLRAALDRVPEQQPKKHIKRQATQRKTPCPAQARSEGEGTTVEQASFDPAPQTAKISTEDVLNSAANDGFRVAYQDTANHDDLPVDLGLVSQLHATENR